MAEPFLSEIRIMSFGFPPKGWALCDGQLLPINQNQALFSLLGTTYGGDGRVNFGLPALQGRALIPMGGAPPPGAGGGRQGHTPALPKIPPHTHTPWATTKTGTRPAPASAFYGVAAEQPYLPPDANVGALNPATIA